MLKLLVLQKSPKLPSTLPLTTERARSSFLSSQENTIEPTQSLRTIERSMSIQLEGTLRFWTIPATETLV